LRLSLDGEASSPCDNLAARICGQILAEQMNIFNVHLLYPGELLTDKQIVDAGPTHLGS
jgi:hypothetical protein